MAVRIRPGSPIVRRLVAQLGRRGTLRPCRSGFESPRADHSGGTRGRCVAASLSAKNRRVRFPCVPPEWARRSTGGFVACTHEMRVRFPPGPPQACCGGKGRRPLEPHKLPYAGSIPASATNSRFVQREDSGLTSRLWGFDSLTGYHVRWFSGRWVIGSPPASGAGMWRFESSRPDHCQIKLRSAGVAQWKSTRL